MKFFCKSEANSERKIVSFNNKTYFLKVAKTHLIASSYTEPESKFALYKWMLQNLEIVVDFGFLQN